MTHQDNEEEREVKLTTCKKVTQGQYGPVECNHGCHKTQWHCPCCWFKSIGFNVTNEPCNHDYLSAKFLYQNMKECV